MCAELGKYLLSDYSQVSTRPFISLFISMANLCFRYLEFPSFVNVLTCAQWEERKHLMFDRVKEEPSSKVFFLCHVTT